MNTPFNIETVERSIDKDGKHHFIYMRLTQYNGWGEMVARWRFKSWK